MSSQLCRGTAPQQRGQIVLNIKGMVLPRGAPTLDAPADHWHKFIKRCQTACPLSSRSGLHKMFPGTIGSNQYPDDEDSDLNPPTRQQVRAFLIMECLAPVPWSSHDRMVWVQGLVRLFVVPGRYRALLEWAGVTPLQNGRVAWSGQFNNQASMTDIVAYVAANGVTVQDADDAIWWARSATQEMVTRIEEAGGFDNPSTSIHYTPIRQDLQVPIPNDAFERTREWYKNEAQSWGVPQSEVSSLVMTSTVQIEDQVFKRFGEATVMFNLDPFPTTEDTEDNSGHGEEGQLVGELALM